MNLKNVDYHVTDVCNLNCVSCGHFCPLVPKDTKPKDIIQVHKDFRALYNATEQGKYLDQLTLTGGEVTLHPNLKDIITIAVKYFPGKIKIWTNGLKYQWFIDHQDLIKDNHIVVCMTNYGLKVHKEGIPKMKEVFGDFYSVDRLEDDGKPWFFKQFFDEHANVDSDHIFNCQARKECLQLKNQRLYTCQYAAYLGYFKDYFHLNMRNHPGISGVGLSIDLNNIDGKMNTFEDLDEWRNTALSTLCTCCIDCVPELKQLQHWKTSDKKLDEWLR